MNKKLILKIVTFLLTAVMGLSVFVGCGCGPEERENGIILDPNKESILISVYGGGFGSDWATKMINEYNATMDSKYQFAKVADSLDDTNTIAQKIMSSVVQADIYFTDASDIGTLIQANKLLDLSEIWNATPDGNGVKIRDKFAISDILDEIWSDESGKYAIPYTCGTAGIVYDHDLFENSNWLILDNSTENGLSKGLDGIEGTYDDGLPATEAEFVALIAKIKRANMIPYTIMGAISGAGAEHLRESIHAQYEGLESYLTSFSYDGHMYYPSDKRTENITKETGYKIFTQSEGRDKAVDFLLANVLRDEYLDTASEKSSHTAAEQRFLFSHNEDAVSIAMTLQGCWWENEARPAFESDASRHGRQYSYGKRRFGFLPIPALNNQNPTSDGKAFYSVNTHGSVFAHRSEDEEKNREIIKFLTHFASDAGLNSFTETVGVIPAYNFELKKEVYDGLTYFGQVYYDIMKAENSVIVAPTLYKYFSPLNYVGTNTPKRLAVTVDNYPYSFLVNAFYAKKTAEAIKTAMKGEWTESKWIALCNEVQ